MNVSDNLYSTLQKEDKDDYIHFHCPNCNIDKIMQELHELRSRNISSADVSGVDARFEQMEKKIDNLAKVLTPLLGVHDTNMPPSSTSSEGTKKSYADIASKNSAPGRIVTVADLHSAQKADMDSRSIVVVGLLEHACDMSDAEELVKEIDISARVVECFRMGVQKEPSTKPRLLKVILPSSTVARSVLQGANKLKVSKRFSTVYIRKSMSRDERLFLHKLQSKRKELSEKFKCSSPQTKFVVVNDKLLKYDNCVFSSDGILGRGMIDNNFKFWFQNDEVVTNLDNMEKGAEKEGRSGGGPKN